MHLGHARTADPCDETKRGYTSDLGERGAAFLGRLVDQASREFCEDRIFRVAQ